jgi:hypothetical protein
MRVPSRLRFASARLAEAWHPVARQAEAAPLGISIRSSSCFPDITTGPFAYGGRVLFRPGFFLHP